MGPDKAVLRKVSEEKDIGVIIDGKLSFSNHMHGHKIKKAKSIMGPIIELFWREFIFIRSW